MIKKVKKWLGIEGVKVELVLPESIQEKDGMVNGSVRFSSMNAQTVTRLTIRMTERYKRGRGKEKLTDEYKIGEISMATGFEVPGGEVVEIDFSLPFGVIRSDIENFGRKNFLFRGMTGIAKFAYGVKSIYFVTAEAEVEGVALSPFDKKELKMK